MGARESEVTVDWKDAVGSVVGSGLYIDVQGLGWRKLLSADSHAPNNLICVQVGAAARQARLLPPPTLMYGMRVIPAILSNEPRRATCPPPMRVPAINPLSTESRTTQSDGIFHT
jgi:hypothetical protein